MIKLFFHWVISYCGLLCTNSKTYSIFTLCWRFSVVLIFFWLWPLLKYFLTSGICRYQVCTLFFFPTTFIVPFLYLSQVMQICILLVILSLKLYYCTSCHLFIFSLLFYIDSFQICNIHGWSESIFLSTCTYGSNWSYKRLWFWVRFAVFG